MLCGKKNQRARLSQPLVGIACLPRPRSACPSRQNSGGLPSRHADIFRRMETLHFQEHDRSHLCPARDPTSVQCALPTLKCTQAITARSKSNSYYPKPQKRHCASPPRSSAPPPPNWKLLDLSLLTNLPDTWDGPQLSHGSVSSPSKLSPKSSWV